MPKYQYDLVNITYVKENPEEYIIPDCIDACKILWEKGINTTQCSNLDDKNHRYVEIDNIDLSDENKSFLYNMINSKADGFAIGSMTHLPRLYVNCEGIKASERLCELANMLSLQDTNLYTTAKDYLDSFKRTDGQYKLFPTGEVRRDYNPKYENATLADALTFNDEWNLYAEEEGRIYASEDALNIHLNYLEQAKNTKKM